MLKYLNIFAPALGGTALMLGSAYGFATYQSNLSKAEMLQDRLAQVEAHEARAKALVDSEVAKADYLEKRIAAVQEAARLKLLETAADPVQQIHATNVKLALGRPAHTVEIAAWDIDVLPDGRGLPEGRGDVWTGEEVFAERCASCHGDFAEGVDNWPVLAGGLDTLGDKDPVKTVGSYWPYLSTVWDYVNRSMPFGEAQSLTPDEVYAITAYILYSSDLVEEDFELSHENFATFEMYNKEGFVVDDRAIAEYEQWRAEPCMVNCKPSVEITMRASVLDVTPDEGGDEVEPIAAVATSTNDTVAGLDPALIDAGAKVFKKCAACHQVGANAKNRSGPQLNALLGRTIGGVDGFKYSSVFMAAANEGRVWDHTSLTAFLTKPRDYMKGTKMAFAGLKKESDIKALIAYLESINGK